MPTQEFALNSTGTSRVQIYYGDTEGSTTVLLNRSLIGSISHREELMLGREFILKNGSVLTVRLVNNEFHVISNGQSLRLMSGADIARAEVIAANESKKAAEAELTSRATTARATEITAAAIAPVRESSKVSTSQPTLKRSLGYIIVVNGGLLALFAFFSLPYFTLGPLSFSESQIANLNGIFWLDLLFSIVVVAIAGWQILMSVTGSTTSERAVAGIMVLVILDFFIMIIRFFFLEPNYPSYASPPSSSIFSASPTVSLAFGSGFWLSVVAMIAVLVGGIIQARKEW